MKLNETKKHQVSSTALAPTLALSLALKTAQVRRIVARPRATALIRPKAVSVILGYLHTNSKSTSPSYADPLYYFFSSLPSLPPR
jgi:hypothetical protein